MDVAHDRRSCAVGWLLNKVVKKVGGTSTNLGTVVQETQTGEHAQYVVGLDGKMQKLDAQPQPEPATDVSSQLEQLAALHDRGELTDEEFDEQKRQILGT
jgi:hypothetical protein